MSDYTEFSLWESFTDTSLGFLIYSYAKWIRAIRDGFKDKGSFRVGRMGEGK